MSFGRCVVLVGLGALMVGVAGCGSDDSSPYGADPDINTVQSHFDHPDGTFDTSNAGSVLGSQESAGQVPDLGFGGSATGNTGGTKTKALHILGDPKFACAALEQKAHSGSCACPNGGDFQYSLEQTGSGQNANATVRIAFNSCAVEDGSVNGREYEHIESNNGSVKVIAVVDVTAVKAGKTTHVAIEELVSADSSGFKAEFAARVNDGFVVMSVNVNVTPATPTTTPTTPGTTPSSVTAGFTVRDKRGTWTCGFAAGGGNASGTCTGPNGSFEWKKQS